VGKGYIEDDAPGPSRRELIRRGAILLGVGAWAAPLVQVVRQRGHGGGGDGGSAPEVIGVRQVTSECLTCAAVTCGDFIICGTSGVFDCVCVPSTDVYPMAACVCGEAGFCEDLTPCSEGCPPGYGCAQGCCDVPVCLPPCPTEEAFASFAAPETQEGAGRLTVTGKRV
jgi:hypothetical protein